MAPMPEELLERAARGEAPALARLISIMADRREGWTDTLAGLYRRPVTGRILGVTGAPGAGKSTLVDAMIASLRSAGRRVGVVAVDPSSPFTGGAILGDRVRMGRHATDPGVFIRSLATRGQLGGLGPATAQAARLLLMAGFDPVIIETVGVGQAEVDVMGVADLVLMVLVPGGGDHVQCLKAGVMEIGDVFVVNKADRDGADRLVGEVEMLLRLGRPDEDPGLRLVRTVAVSGTGVDELLACVEGRCAVLDASGEAAERRLRQVRGQLRAQLRREIVERFMSYDRERRATDDAVERIHEGTGDPVTAARVIVDDFIAWLGGSR